MKPKMNDKPAAPRLTSNIRIGRRGVDYNALAELGRRKPAAFAAFVQERIDSGEFSWDKIDSLPHLFAALADVQVPTQMPVFQSGVMATVTTSAFPLVTGGLTIARFNTAYQRVPSIAQELVEDFDDNKKMTVMARLHGLDNNPNDEVKEGDDFPMVGAGEDGVVIGQGRDGRRLAITAETIEENNVAGFVRQIDFLGEFAADSVENKTLSRVCDVKGSGSSPAAPYVYRPLSSSGGTSLYSTTANTPGTRAPSGTRIENNALVDETDLGAARTRLASMLNDNGQRIYMPSSECVLLVPDALLEAALKITMSELVPGSENEYSAWGPRGMFRPRTLISSPKLDSFSTNAWYYGMPKRQFMRKWKLRFEYVTLTGNTQRFLEARIAFQARIAWDCEIGANDYVYFVQNLGGTTPPS